ncbi:MAG: hypothetical protein KAJ06_09255 [Gammaproteobacteria bacterium]|nr:hypothetical protein [Gammaproteobacteria bacterium]
MAKLDILRMINQTKVKAVDNVSNQFEEDLADILGVPDGQTISAAFFGENLEEDTPGDTSKPVQVDGSIKGLIKFLLAAATADPADSVGLEFVLGDVSKRLCFVDSSIRIYEASGSGWVLQTDLEIPGSMTLQGLYNTNMTLSIGEADKLVVVDSLGEYYVHAVDPGGSGATEFIALTDTPAGYGAAGQMVVVDEFGTPPLAYGAIPSALINWGVYVKTGTTLIDAGTSPTSIDSWVSAAEWGGWEIPVIGSGTTITVPYQGFYQIGIRIKGNPHELSGRHCAYISGTNVTGPATEQRWRGGRPIYDHAWDPDPNKPLKFGPMMNGIFATDASRDITVKVLYESQGGPERIKAFFDATIVRIA